MNEEEEINKSITSESLDTSSSLEFSEIKSFLDSTRSSISPELKTMEENKKDHDNKSDTSIIEIEGTQKTNVQSAKGNCKRSLNFDHLTPTSGELNVTNQRYPARLSVTPDPLSSSISRSFDSFLNIFPPSGTVTIHSENEKTQDQTLPETIKHDSKINEHSQNEDMIVQIKILEQEKKDYELEIKSLKEKLKYYDQTSEIFHNINEQKTQPHRLDHRSPTVIIKEFRKMEEVLKVTQQKLHDSIEEKKKLNQQISLLNIKGQLPISADINRIPQYLQLKSDYDRLCGRTKILQLKYETESKNHTETNLKLTEECNILKIQLKQQENIIKNMNDAYEIANNKIEDMSTGKQKLYDEIDMLKQTITSLQNKISEMNNGWESIDSTSSEDEVVNKTSKRRKHKTRNKQSAKDPTTDQRHIPVLRSPQRRTNSNHLPDKGKDWSTQNCQQNLENHQQNRAQNSENLSQRSNQTPSNQQLNQDRYSHQLSQRSDDNQHPLRTRNYHETNFDVHQPQHRGNLLTNQNNNYEGDQRYQVNQQRSYRRRGDHSNNYDIDVRQEQYSSTTYEQDNDEPQFIPVIKNMGKNSKRKYHNIRKQNRPACPFLRNNNYCPSERCLYFHERNYSRNNERVRNYEQESERNENTSVENPMIKNQRNGKRNITCKFYLQNRCLYGSYCRYRHTETNQYS